MTSTAYVQLVNFQDAIHKNDFDIYCPVIIFNFAQNVQKKKKQYITGGFLRILVPSQILAPSSHF